MHGRYGSAITVGINADDAITGGGSGDGIKMYESTIPLPPRSLPKPRACCAAGVVGMINVAEVAAIRKSQHLAAFDTSGRHSDGELCE